MAQRLMPVRDHSGWPPCPVPPRFRNSSSSGPRTMFAAQTRSVLRSPALGSYWLITTVVAEGFLATKAKRMHDRQVIEGEETGIIGCRKVGMFVPHP
jgi:hypothetical protein